MTANERTARAALSRLMEPQDAAGLALVRAVGAEDALRIATGQLKPGPSLEQEITGLLADAAGSQPVNPDHSGAANHGRLRLSRWRDLPQLR